MQIEYRKHVHNGVPTVTALPAPDRTPILLMSHIDSIHTLYRHLDRLLSLAAQNL